ncbi:NUDIX hydrolase [Haloquadratum walsbyi]|jgi:NTP pyrophosphohydrolases including oxidative damage repair enzymes|uniref:NTP pyrophosphohydrolase n=1 Tax=Haloquadratum walsbyi J07HQW2 TaxID=1238425 RepID=U1MYD0_9EURY|nr:NUDIX hydrolase [Haloquadratum walsbyi]ERG95494.1 MAG: NTP pyrophosphohydrolase [Haloquadratum walsbyi J07HQW2]
MATEDSPSDDLAWQTDNSDIEYSCPGFDVRRDDVVLPDGTSTDFHSVEEPPAVIILPFTPTDDIVFIKEWRQAVGRVNQGLPAGTVEDGDTALLDAAKRELIEETGYEAGSMKKLFQTEPANGLLDTVHHYFVAYDCEQTASQQLDYNESIYVNVTAYEAFRAAVRQGEIQDGRAVTAVAQYELKS